MRQSHYTLWLIVLTLGLLLPLPKKLYDLLHVNLWAVSDWIYATQTLIIGISAIIAVFTIRSAKAISKEKATLEIILSDNKDGSLIEAKSDLLLFVKNPQKFYEEYHNRYPNLDKKDDNNLDLPAILKKDKDDLTPAQEHIRTKMLTVLSRHEFYAVGINNGLLDERLFKRMSCSNFIQLWEQVSPAVNQMRTQIIKILYLKILNFLQQDGKQTHFVWRISLKPVSSFMFDM